MLGYQHDYHAGNHADVLKHAVLALLVRALARKPKALRVIDTHAGSGVYDLGGALAQRGREHEAGALRVFGAADAPPAARPYLDALAHFNPAGTLTRYPGSPALALHLLRETDQLELFELHPRARAALRAAFGRERRVHLHERDGFEGLTAVVPPPERRGLVLIDPAYEEKADYTRVPEVLAAALRRWGGGVYAVWYPLLGRGGSTHLLRQIGKLALPDAFRVELAVTPDAEGLKGSGLVIVNLPYEVDAALVELLPWLAGRLATNPARAWTAEWLARQGR